MNQDGVDKGRRRFLTATTAVVGGVGAVFAAVPFIKSWNPSARAQAAGAPVEQSLAQMEPGQKIEVVWRGKPVWIVRRTEEMLAQLDENADVLADPESAVVSQQPDYARNTYRSIKPEFLVLIGLCTHLGCVPLYRPDQGSEGADWPGGFFCPCHGSKFDLAGRVFAGVPAPTNLEVPPYQYIDESTILVGADEGAA